MSGTAHGVDSAGRGGAGSASLRASYSPSPLAGQRHAGQGTALAGGSWRRDLCRRKEIGGPRRPPGLQPPGLESGAVLVLQVESGRRGRIPSLESPGVGPGSSFNFLFFFFFMSFPALDITAIISFLNIIFFPVFVKGHPLQQHILEKKVGPWSPQSPSPDNHC